MRSLGNQRVSWEECVEALCYRFGGQKNLVEELIDLKQMGDLDSYIHDFDILWNKVGIEKRQVLVIFLWGLEVKIKNTVKMFEPKVRRQTYNLAKLQANTLANKQTSGYL